MSVQSCSSGPLSDDRAQKKLNDFDPYLKTDRGDLVSSVLFAWASGVEDGPQSAFVPCPSFLAGSGSTGGAPFTMAALGSLGDGDPDWLGSESVCIVFAWAEDANVNGAFSMFLSISSFFWSCLQVLVVASGVGAPSLDGPPLLLKV